MIDYKSLEAFAMVIGEGGFEKAARKLHLTQSAVSQRVKQLEELYGKILLQRTSPPQPTAAGIPLLTHYRQVQQLEHDLQYDLARENHDQYTSLSIGVNADTLATWFIEAVQPVILAENILLDIHVEDQDRTHELMQSGMVWGCVSSRNTPFQGCRIERLGKVNYGAFAAPGFQKKWFENGLTESAVEQTPMARFNLKDDLNSRFFQLLFNWQPEQPPTYFIPSTEIYAECVCRSLCYGILPEQQSADLETAGRIVNLSPNHSIKMELYWHSWSLKSDLMERFSAQFIGAAKKVLGQ